MNGKNASEHGGNVYSAMRKSSLVVNNILDFSANINPLGLSSKVLTAINDSLPFIVHYPDANAYDLKESISQYYNVPTDLITVGNGAVETIYILCHMTRPKRILVTAPTFSEYSHAALACGSSIDYFYLSNEENFELNTELMAGRLSNIDIAFICNPNNPTGNLITNTQIKLLLDKALTTDTLVVVDESFIDFLPDSNLYSCKGLLSDYPNLIVLHSLTKFYAVPGLRLGFTLANRSITQLLHKGKDPWNVNTLAQAVGTAALQDIDYQKSSRQFMQNSKQDLWEKLNQFKKLIMYPPSVNFMLVNIRDTGLSSSKLKLSMLEKGILIRDCSNYPGLSHDYIRVAIKRPQDHNQLITSLNQVLGDKHDQNYINQTW